MADTIPPGFRLVPSAPGTRAAMGRRSAATDARNLLAQITELIRVYNARVSRLPLHERFTRDLTIPHLAQRLDGTITIIHHESPGWLATASPPASRRPAHVGTGHYVRPMLQSTRAELRAYFIRKGGSKAEAWRRFPPSTSAEHAQMAKDLQRPAKPPTDPMERVIRAAARKRGADANDPEFRAKIRAEQEALNKLLEEFDI